METLIVFTTLLASACTARLPRSANPITKEDTNSDYVMKRSAAQPASQKGWAPQGYSGPLAILDVRPDGTLAETPEVMAARAAHLAALETARASNPDMDNGEYDPHKYGDHQYGVVSHAEDLAKSVLMYQSLAKGHNSGSKAVNEDGQSQAMAATMAAAHDIWKAKNSAAVDPTDAVYWSAQEQNKPYFGPLAMLQILDTGFLADTSDVATARKIHFKALAEALAAAESWKTKNTKHHPWN
ncbi:hypothetical protein J6590_000929 [Homalodisca vitripennis]|nr:hypothetical protein J6590_102599 [Homalodisca vitripennis]KAG8328271.1 hypothetical protein J6590_000929 [Homalodisca vitripennis]